MKLTNAQLKQIILEELRFVLKESWMDPYGGARSAHHDLVSGAAKWGIDQFVDDYKQEEERKAKILEDYLAGDGAALKEMLFDAWMSRDEHAIEETEAHVESLFEMLGPEGIDWAFARNILNNEFRGPKYWDDPNHPMNIARAEREEKKWANREKLSKHMRSQREKYEGTNK